ncbi:MAG TPA: sulfotransferase [Solirubrobacteraceae bacterium]|nr:sulfotransferase [Solirubrobacteraceae bacterium]
MPEPAAAIAATPAGVKAARVPDFFIVGHAKSGTSALYEMLRRHPQIFMPEGKEPWFLASDMLPRFQPPLAGPPVHTLADYLALFSDAAPQQRIGEASSSYLWSATAAGAIAELAPGGRIIALLREPASFLHSLHLQFLRTHVESVKSLRKAMALEPARAQGRRIPRRSHRPQLLQYSQHVRYVEQLRRYHAVFPREQVRVLIYEDFRDDNVSTVRSLLRFLDVDDGTPVESIRANPSFGMRSQGLDELVHSVSVGRGPVSRAAKAALKAITPRAARRQALGLAQRRVVHRAAPPPDDAFMLELRRRFTDEVVALGEYLQRDLVALWGYDRLG